jgi:DNA-binding IclR family transcriptional regulator
MANGTDVVITDIVESQQRVRVHALHRGYSSDLHARALGKAVLAYLDEAVVRRYFAEHPPRRLTARTVVSIDEILGELERVRRRGSSEDVEEFCEGVCCVGAPFFAADGRPAGSLSVSMPSFRFRARRVDAREAVLAAANAATAALQSVERRVRNG